MSVNFTKPNNKKEYTDYYRRYNPKQANKKIKDMRPTINKVLPCIPTKNNFYNYNLMGYRLQPNGICDIMSYFGSAENKNTDITRIDSHIDGNGWIGFKNIKKENINITHLHPEKNKEKARRGELQLYFNCMEYRIDGKLPPTLQKIINNHPVLKNVDPKNIRFHIKGSIDTTISSKSYTIPECMFLIKCEIYDLCRKCGKEGHYAINCDKETHEYSSYPYSKAEKEIQECKKGYEKEILDVEIELTKYKTCYETSKKECDKFKTKYIDTSTERDNAIKEKNEIQEILNNKYEPILCYDKSKDEQLINRCENAIQLLNELI